MSDFEPIEMAICNVCGADIPAGEDLCFDHDPNYSQCPSWCHFRAVDKDTGEVWCVKGKSPVCKVDD